MVTEETLTCAMLGVNNWDFIINEDEEAEFSKSNTQPALLCIPALDLTSTLHFWVFCDNVPEHDCPFNKMILN